MSQGGCTLTPATAGNKTFKATYPDDCGTVLNAIVESYQGFLERTYTKVSEDTLQLIKEARDTLKKDKASAEKRATDAEGNFANERQARVKLLVANAVAAGQITGSEVDATEKLLANAKNFDEESDALAKRAKKIHTQSQTGNLNPGSGQEGAHASILAQDHFHAETVTAALVTLILSSRTSDLGAPANV